VSPKGGRVSLGPGRGGPSVGGPSSRPRSPPVSVPARHVAVARGGQFLHDLPGPGTRTWVAPSVSVRPVAPARVQRNIFWAAPPARAAVPTPMSPATARRDRPLYPSYTKPACQR